MSFAGQAANPPAPAPQSSAATNPTAASNEPLTPAQIAYEFIHLPLDTQKMLMKILMSQPSGEEKQETTEQLDDIFSTLPPGVQQSLYAKWDALSDEQRIAMKAMSPTMIKGLLAGAFRAEMDEHAGGVIQPMKDVVAPVKKAIEESRSFAERSRAYVQSLINRKSAAPEQSAAAP